MIHAPEKLHFVYITVDTTEYGGVSNSRKSMGRKKTMLIAVKLFTYSKGERVAECEYSEII